MLKSGNPSSQSCRCDSNDVRRLKDSSINVVMYIGQLLVQIVGKLDHLEELVCRFVKDLFRPKVNKAMSVE